MYPTLDTPLGIATVDSGYIRCTCGMKRTFLGWFWVGRDGRLSNVSGDPRYDLAPDRVHVMCSACSRVFDADGFTAGVTELRQVRHYRRSAALAQAKRDYLASDAHPALPGERDLRVWERRALPPESRDTPGYLNDLVERFHVRAELTRLPDGYQRCYVIRVTSIRCPNPISIVIVCDNTLSDVTAADVLAECANSDSARHLLADDAELLG